MSRFARNGDVEIAYEDLGGAGGDPLQLVMGLGVSRAWWPPGFAQALVDRGFHVVAYDQRDSGESTHLPDGEAVHPAVALFRSRPAPYAAEDMTDDAVAVMDAVGWKAAHLFGHSLGGLIAQRIALRHPGRTLSMTSSGSMPSDAGRLRMLRTSTTTVAVSSGVNSASVRAARRSRGMWSSSAPTSDSPSFSPAFSAFSPGNLSSRLRRDGFG